MGPSEFKMDPSGLLMDCYSVLLLGGYGLLLGFNVLLTSPRGLLLDS